MNIRNFCILAHIDHGKSTLADRFLEITGTIEKRKMREQFLDMHPLEREKGITIKMQPVRMIWKPDQAESLISKPESLNKFKSQNSKNSFLEITDSKREFVLNLIDTPGHADFSYEVSRALAAVEGAILLVDAAQGVQAQTLSNLGLAQRQGLFLLPVVNKIDLPSAEIERTAQELVQLLGVSSGEVCRISAKTGEGVEELLRAVVERVPSPDKIDRTNRSDIPFRALVFDSIFDSYQGVIAYVRIMEGEIRKGDKIVFLASGAVGEVLEVGYFLPGRSPAEGLWAGEIGYVATGFKEADKVRVGDTITNQTNKTDRTDRSYVEPLPGYREPEPMVFASLFPLNQDEYEVLRASLEKLKLNDAALTFLPEDSRDTLGRGFRAGFLGVLHMEIAVLRLRQEYGIEIVVSNPSVAFKVSTPQGEKLVYSASKMPPRQEVLAVKEPWVRAEIITSSNFLGILAALIPEREGTIIKTEMLSRERMLIEFEAPLSEIIVDFADVLKSATHGFASMSYRLADHRSGDLVRLEILVAGQRIPALAEMVRRKNAARLARERVEKLKELLPRELFAIAIQAEIEGRIAARETLPALKKDVTGHLYGGDRTRKMKLWARQKKGKERLKERGKVEIPPEVFFKMLRH